MIPVLEIGGTHVTAALVDPAVGEVVPGPDARLPIDGAGSTGEILGAVIACGALLAQPAGQAWGVAIPGPFDYARGIGRFERVGKFDSLNGVDVRAALVDGLRAADVAFVNDADAFLLGEWASGAAKDVERVAGITLGTGVGSAFLAAGRIVDRGPDVPPEGRLDLLSIDERPLEDTVSRRALLAAYRERSASQARSETIDVDELARRAQRGDPVARDVFEGAMAALGRALAPWLDRFEAEMLVVGGSIARSWHLVAPPIQHALPDAVDVRPAARPDEAALVGAAWCTSDRRATGFGSHTGRGENVRGSAREAGRQDAS